MNNKITTRVEWVDIAKAITIILMVYGHVMRGLYSSSILKNETLFQLNDDFFHAFRMPLFIIISGLFFLPSIKKHKPDGLLKNRISTILYPYVVWSLLHTFIEVLLSSYTNEQVPASTLLTCVIIPRTHFWFLFALFFMNLTNILLYRFFEKKWLIISFVIAFFFYFVPIDLSVFTKTFRHILFFNIGILISPYLLDKRNEVRLSKPLFLFLSFVAFMVIEYFYVFKIIEVFFYPLIVAVSGSIFVVSFSCMLVKFKERLIIRFLSIIGTRTMYIYLMHVLATAGVRIILSKVLGIDNVYIHIVLAVVAGVGFPYLLTKWLGQNKYYNMLFKMPWKI